MHDLQLSQLKVNDIRKKIRTTVLRIRLIILLSVLNFWITFHWKLITDVCWLILKLKCKKLGFKSR